MARVIGEKVVLDNGQTITPQVGGWYDGQQYWNGSLSQPGQIHPESNQQGAGGLVSNEVIAQTNPDNVDYIRKRRESMNLSPSPQTGVPQAQPYVQPNASNAPRSTVGSTGLGLGETQAPSIDLPSLYQNLYQSSGVGELETKINDLEKKFLEQKGKISDNPFADASMIDQRLARLKNKYESEVAPLRGEIAQKKADIETQLNLETKQFDINSQVAQQSLQMFNSLLGSGALDNASGDDIANLTRATGLSSSMINSAISANKAKNVSTSSMTFDDGTNQGFVIIDDKTGDIISRQIIAASKPQQSTQTERTTNDQQQTTSNLVGDVQRGVTLKDLIGHYSQPGGLTVEEIYRLYNVYSPYGSAKESIDEVKEGRFINN